MLQKKNIISFLLMFCLSFAVFAQKKVKKAASNATALRFETLVHQIGTVKQGEVISHKFRFTNTSRSAVEVKNATATCGCTVPDYPFIPILPGEQGEIGVTFNTTHKLGHQKPIITVTTSAGTYYVSLEGTVTD